VTAALVAVVRTSGADGLAGSDDTETLVAGLSAYAAEGDLRATMREIGPSQRRIDAYLERQCPAVVQ
jgi:hypothetical protein